MDHECERPYVTAGRERQYEMACGSCGPCLARGALGMDGLTELQRAWLLGLDALAAPATTGEVAGRAPDFVRPGRHACLGGWKDSLSRVPWEALGPMGLVDVEVVGGTHMWAVTEAGRAALRADGHVPNLASPRPAPLFG